MKRFFTLCGLLAAMVACGPDPLPRDYVSNDAKTCIDSVFIGMAARATNELHSLMVAQHGKVLYERWGTGHSPEELHVCWSASKTFTATAIGFAVQDGLLSVDDPLVKFFPEYVSDNCSDTLKAVTVKHLLIMSSGMAHDRIRTINANLDKTPTKDAFSDGFIFYPGERYRYNSRDSYLLSAIVTKLTGLRVSEYLEKKLFSKIGIKDYIWEQSEEGVDFGGWGLFTTTENLTRMGIWMAAKGNWKGEQLLDEAWFDEAMFPQIMQYKGKYPELSNEELIEKFKDDDKNQGYGYQMWCYTHGAYCINGAHNQLVIVIPDKDAAITVTAYNRDFPALIGDIWKYIYPLL